MCTDRLTQREKKGYINKSKTEERKLNQREREMKLRGSETERVY